MTPVPATAPSAVVPPPPSPAEQAALAKVHEARLYHHYGKEVIVPLVNFGLPGGAAAFAAAAGRARAAGVPENLLAEATSLRAVFDVDQAGVRAVVPALRRARAEWRPETSLFPSATMSEFWLNALTMAMSMESMEPGSFVKMARPVRKRRLAELIREEQRIIDSGVNMIAIEENLRTGTVLPEARWLDAGLVLGVPAASRGHGDVLVDDLPPTRGLAQAEGGAHVILKSRAVRGRAPAVGQAVGKADVRARADLEGTQVKHTRAGRLGLPLVPTFTVGGGALILQRGQHVEDEHLGGMVGQNVLASARAGRIGPGLEDVADLFFVVHVGRVGMLVDGGLGGVQRSTCRVTAQGRGQVPQRKNKRATMRRSFQRPG